MEGESSDGLPVPIFHGRLEEDPKAHENSLRAWLHVKGVPLHSREAQECFLLSLRSSAALHFERTPPSARSTFEDGARWLQVEFGSSERLRLAEATARNRLDQRGFRERGRRNEFISDLVSDLELLFARAGIEEDEEKRRAFVRCFLEFPKAMRRFSATPSWTGVIAEAVAWETAMVAREREGAALRYGSALLDTSHRPGPEPNHLSSPSPELGDPSSSVHYERFPPPPPQQARPTTSPTFYRSPPSAPSTVPETAEPDQHLRPNHPSPRFLLHEGQPSFDSLNSTRSLSHFQAQADHGHQDYLDETDARHPRSHSALDYGRSSDARRARPALPDFGRHSMANRAISTPDLHYDTYSHEEAPGVRGKSSRPPNGVSFEQPRSLSSSTVRGIPSKSKGGLISRLFGKKQDTPSRSDPRFARSPSPSPSPTGMEFIEEEKEGSWSRSKVTPMSASAYGRPAKTRLAYAPE
ncbi:hypothetical protein BCR35DRAFT_39353 [Leucosporidium creatinivorum]|uniref:Uncharacterized protein n=1 Tax=Leucosporidium creatinivorum TaxID=106004 RepID=A0A1Y2FU42_9BASI|nr:hypothetical protein BCR35DRAFT_39353 [Leucosporidium creatinivorum]